MKRGDIWEWEFGTYILVYVQVSVAQIILYLNPSQDTREHLLSQLGDEGPSRVLLSHEALPDTTGAWTFFPIFRNVWIC